MKCEWKKWKLHNSSLNLKKEGKKKKKGNEWRMSWHIEWWVTRGQRGIGTRNEVKDYTDRESLTGVRLSEDLSVFFVFSFFCNSFICLQSWYGKNFSFSFSSLSPCFFPLVCVRDCSLTFWTKVFFCLISGPLFGFVRCSFFALLFLSLYCFAGMVGFCERFIAFLGVFLLISPSFLRYFLRLSF